MKVQGVWAIALLSGLCVPSLAHAYCPEPRRYSYSGFEDQVSGYIDYLLCLHNDQVGSLNEHARLINQLGDEIDGLRSYAADGKDSAATAIMREVVVKYSAMETENEQLRQRVAELEVRIARIEGFTEAD